MPLNKETKANTHIFPIDRNTDYSDFWDIKPESNGNEGVLLTL